MENLQIIQKSLDYIEDNLKAEITANELADMAGFSTFYYYRLFQKTVGMPIMQYVLQRKLLNAIFDIGRGKKKTNTALDYGFSSYAGFYKAFKREIGYTPSEFTLKFKANRPAKITLIKDGDIMITHKKLSDILENWDISDKSIKDVYYENSGRHNENAFYVGNDFIIKASRDLGKVKKQIELSKDMASFGLYTANVIPAKSGEDYVESKSLYFYLTKRLRGGHINPQEYYKADGTKKAQFIGESIAKLHLALRKTEAAVDDANIYENVTVWALPKVSQLLYIPEKILNSYKDAFGGIYISLPQQIIHRDPNPANIIVNEERCGFIDFELSERNIRIFDPCYAASAILSETFSKESFNQWIEIYKNIVFGYNKVAKLTSEEMQALPFVILSNQLICLAFFSENRKYESILKINLEMTNLILDNFEKLKIK